MNDGNDYRSWTACDEENLLLEIAEDNRMCAIGINPDWPPHKILLELDKRCEVIRAKRRRQREGE